MKRRVLPYAAIALLTVGTLLVGFATSGSFVPTVSHLGSAGGHAASADDASACATPCLNAKVLLPSGPGVPGISSSGSFSTFATGVHGAEPTIGVTPSGTTVYVQAGLNTMRSTNSGSTWTNIRPLATGVTSLDAMAYYDPVIDRLYADQLYVACTVMAWTDNPSTATAALGDVSWKSNPAACGIPGIDHQKLEGGPSPTFGIANEGRALYMGYSQAGGGAVVAKSIDGGATFVSNVAISSVGRGSVLWPTGPVTTDPAGSWVYIPAPGPNGLRVGFSGNEGLTWSSSPVAAGAGTVSGVDPEVAVDAAGNVYVVWWDAVTFQLKYAFSTNHATSWSAPIAITTSATFGSTIYPTAVARSTGKMDVAFYGTSGTAGPDNCPNAGASSCVWFLYNAQITSANSATPSITTEQVTAATDAIQIGKICTQGTGCTGNTRNLLDFIDIEVDGSGFAHIAYADGCTGACNSSTTGQSTQDFAFYARQTTGTPI